MYDGAIQEMQRSAISLDSVGGYVGLVYALIPFAERVATFMRTPEFQDRSHPGVFEYDVVETLGSWFVLNLEPSIEAFDAELIKLWTEFKKEWT
jgi:hypothetical protein